jgi:putative transposase
MGENNGGRPMYDPRIHHRHSFRLKGYDYSRPGGYFITRTTYARKHLFGEIIGGEMNLSAVGEIVKKCWEEIPRHHVNTTMDSYVIMPDHIHGIIIINPPDDTTIAATVGAQNIEPQQHINRFQHLVPDSISTIVGQFKAVVTRISRRDGHTEIRWQRNYYETVIQSEDGLYRIRKYIENNVRKWSLDRGDDEEKLD